MILSITVGNSGSSSNREFNKSQIQLTHNQPALFPNPTRSKLGIVLPTHWLDNGLVRAELYDNAGQQLRTFELEELQTKLDVQKLRNGMYHLVFFTKEGHVVSERFVKVD